MQDTEVHRDLTSPGGGAMTGWPDSDEDLCAGNHEFTLSNIKLSALSRLIANLRPRQAKTCSGKLTGGTVTVTSVSFRGFVFIQPPGTLKVANKNNIHIRLSGPNADSAKL